MHQVHNSRLRDIEQESSAAAAAADIMVNTERHVSARDAWQSLYTDVTTDPPCCFIYALVYDAILLTGVVIEFLTRSSLLDFHFLELNLLFVNSTPISLYVCIDSLRQTFTFVIYNDMANPFWLYSETVVCDCNEIFSL